MAADELAAEARIITLRAERERELVAVRSLEADLARVRASPTFRPWPRAFGRGLGWGVVVGIASGVACLLRVLARC